MGYPTKVSSMVAMPWGWWW